MQKLSYISPVLFDLGKHIKLIRHLKNMTQTELGHYCNIEKSTISKIEAGMVNVGFLTLDRISKGLGVTVCELTDDKKPASTVKNTT